MEDEQIQNEKIEGNGKKETMQKWPKYGVRGTPGAG